MHDALSIPECALSAIDSAMIGHATTSSPVLAWRRLGLMNSQGELLWRSSPPGTWPATGPHEALAWPDADAFHDWLSAQSFDFRRRLSEGFWELVELETRFRKLGTMVEAPAPIVADAVCS